MAIFNRKTMDQYTQRMIDWTRGATTQLTDFRVGSKARSIYEAVAIALEDLDDRVYRAIKKAVQLNLYTAFGFTPLPAVNTSGIVRFYARTAPTSDQPYYITMGTQAQASPTSDRGPVTFQTTQDAYIYYNSPTESAAVTINGVSVTGWFYVDVSVVCAQGGIIGNVLAGTVQTLVGAPSGIGAVTNSGAFTSGQDAETLAGQKARFQLFMASRTRGTLASIEYGATTATVLDTTGAFIQERVKSAIVNDDVTNGKFDIYIWNNVGTSQSPPITPTAGTGLAAPAAAPTVAATTPTPATDFPAGTFYTGYSWEDANGETVSSPVSAGVVLTAGQGINATVAAIPSGVKYIDFYTGTATNNLLWSFSVPVVTGMSLTITITKSTPMACSRLLIRAVQKIIDGYTATDGTKIWGYKPAGISYTANSVLIGNVPLAMTVTPRSGYGITDADVTAKLIDLRPIITNAVSSYFATLKPGQTVVRAALEAAVKQIPGVYDVAITAPSGNVVATTATQMLVAQLPIAWTKGTTV